MNKTVKVLLTIVVLFAGSFLRMAIGRPSGPNGTTYFAPVVTIISVIAIAIIWTRKSNKEQ